MGDELFASARLAFDQNRGVRRGHEFNLLDHVLQSSAAAYDLLERTPRLISLTTANCLRGVHKSPIYCPRSSVARTRSSRS